MEKHPPLIRRFITFICYVWGETKILQEEIVFLKIIGIERMRLSYI